MFSPLHTGIPGATTPAKTRPYVTRALVSSSGWNQQGLQRSAERVERPFWWEVLCLLKSQAMELVDRVIEALENSSLKVATTHSLLTH